MQSYKTLQPVYTLGSLSTWKLKKRRAGSFLSPYWPASSLSSILTYWNISTRADIYYSCGYMLMLIDQYKSTLILTKEMSSSAQSSAIVSRFFTIWDFWICQILSDIFTIWCLDLSQIFMLRKASLYLLVSLRAEEEDGDVIELANETSKDDVGNLWLETGFLIKETMKQWNTGRCVGAIWWLLSITV